jgi:hypothetical protein
METTKREILRTLLKIADETDPDRIELLKQRMRILLQESPEYERVPVNGKPSTH